LTNEIGGLGLKSFKSSNVAALRSRCPSMSPCGINKYRKIDGSCNNLRQPKMGQSLTPLSRVLEPAYADGKPIAYPIVYLVNFLQIARRIIIRRSMGASGVKVGS
jgi:hypothetical protein